MKKYLYSTNPALVFLSKKKIDESKRIVDSYKSGTLQQNITVAELRKNKRIYDSVFHPTNGGKIPLPWRMSSFMPMNVAIVIGMVGARSTLSTIFWQGINQTYNSCVNFANRGTGDSSSTSTILKNYSIAMVSAVGSAVGLNAWIKNAKGFSPKTKNLLLAVVPLFAVCFANLVNISATRSNEMTQGISVYDKDGM